MNSLGALTALTVIAALITTVLLTVLYVRLSSIPDDIIDGYIRNGHGYRNIWHYMAENPSDSTRFNRRVLIPAVGISLAVTTALLVLNIIITRNLF